MAAHLSLDNDTQSRRVTVCNAWADRACKQMAASNLPSEAVLEQYRQNHDEAKQFCIWSATMLASLPGSYDLFGKLTRVERVVGPRDRTKKLIMNGNGRTEFGNAKPASERPLNRLNLKPIAWGYLISLYRFCANPRRTNIVFG